MKQVLSTWQEVQNAIQKIPVEFTLAATVLVLEKPEYADAFSKGQLASKLWLIEHLQNRVDLSGKRILICGGWIGALAKLLFHFHPTIAEIVSIEIAADAVNDSMEFVNHERVDAVWADMVQYRYYDEYDIIINTSYEHISTPHTWMLRLPKHKLVVIQSNNATQYEDHVNTHESLNNLVWDVKFGLNDHDLEAFELHIVDLYQRYMVMGTTYYE